jgi:hypothetical protein
MQNKCIHHTVSLCGIPQVYSNYYYIKLYENVEAGFKLAGSCKIISLLKMYNGNAKILSYMTKLLKYILYVQKLVKASAM